MHLILSLQKSLMYLNIVPQISSRAAPVGQVGIPAGGRVRHRLSRRAVGLSVLRPSGRGRPQAVPNAPQRTGPRPSIIPHHTRPVPSLTKAKRTYPVPRYPVPRYLDDLPQARPFCRRERLLHRQWDH